MKVPGTLGRCSRCKGTGEARLNRMNGDTHCYLCNGSGVQRILSAAEKAQERANDEWRAEHATRCYHWDTKIGSLVRRETGTRQAPIRRNLTFFSNMVIGRDNIEAAEEEWRARDAAHRAERRAFAEAL